MAYFCSRDDSTEDSRTQTDVPRAIPLVGPKRYSDVLRMSTTSKITGTPVSKDAVVDTASSSEAEPVTAAAPSERSTTVKEKATGTDRKKKWWRNRRRRTVRVKLAKGWCRERKVPSRDGNLILDILPDDVAVIVPVGRITNLLTTRSSSAKFQRPIIKIERRNVSPQENSSSHNKQGTKKTQCPSCDGHFTSEDQMLDHFLIAHRALEETVEVPATETRKTMSQFRTTKATAEQECTDHGRRTYSRRYLQKESDYPSEYGSIAGLNVCEWNTVAQLFTLPWLLGFDGFCYIMEQYSLQIVDFAKLKLLLSGDVEQNPGPPMFLCHWEGCSESLQSIRLLSQHLINDHVSGRNTCRWGDCFYVEHQIPNRFECHVLNHLYQAVKFQSVVEWENALPNGKLNEHTDLNLCPKYMRSSLNLDLFDSSFQVKTYPYTVADHHRYLASLDFEESPGVKGSYVRVTPPSAPDSTSFSTANIEFCSVGTERPELANSSSMSVVFKGKKDNVSSVHRLGKRKCKDNENKSITPEIWFDTLTKNLEICRQGIEFEKKVTEHLQQVNFLTRGERKGKLPCSFFQFEEAMFKLAATPKCSDGVFVYTVFEYENRYYIKYFESGIYTGFMKQSCLSDILNMLKTKPELVFLSNIGTQSDIIKGTLNTEKAMKNLTRPRPDKTFNSNSDLVKTNLDNCMRLSDETGSGFKCFLFHSVRSGFKADISAGHGTNFRLQTEKITPEYFEIYREKLIRYPLERLPESDGESYDFVKSLLPTEISQCLLQQSLALSSLSSATPKQIQLESGKLGLRFHTRFICNDACSFRNRLFFYFLSNDLQELQTWYSKCTPSKSEVQDVHVAEEEGENLIERKRRKANVAVKKVTITPEMLPQQTVRNFDEGMDSLSDFSISIYDSYARRLLQTKTMFIQIYHEHDSIKAVMNDYSSYDGRFKETDFVVTCWKKTETGGYMTCSCGIYRTLLDLADSTEPLQVLDSSGASCMHCRFMKENVLPNINCRENETVSAMQQFIQSSFEYRDEKIIELSSHKRTKKFSVIDNDTLSFINLSYNRRIDRYIVSCENGFCKSQKGSKKCVDNLLNATLCCHLCILRDKPKFWDSFRSPESKEGQEFNIEDLEQDSVVRQEADDQHETQEAEVETDNDYNFNLETGLWYFPCRSKHSPKKQNDHDLEKNVCARDDWNYIKLKKTEDGFLSGSSLIPDIPTESCACGTGWQNEQRPQGITQKTSRKLVVYTSNAPVKCDVYVRFCMNPQNPCTYNWDEGEKLCIHVLSNETAAGDEIGWEYVNTVLSSKTTFSSFCEKKTKDYKMRNKYCHNFMDSKTFIKWWFSWAASLKIDFRKPCPVCKFKPKHLACDGTKVGIGFRHSNFTEISKPDNENLIEPTLHRRLDRCFLPSSALNNKIMAKCRSYLNYISKKTLNELAESELYTEEIEEEKNRLLEQNLPPSSYDSYFRFRHNMQNKEKEAYAIVMKMLSTTAPVCSLLPSAFAAKLKTLLDHLSHTEEHPGGHEFYNMSMAEMRTYAPELRHLIACSIDCNGELPVDIVLFLLHIVDESLNMETNEAEQANYQPGTYNPGKLGRAYYFSESGEKLRNVRKFSIDGQNRENNQYDDPPADFDKCEKYYSKTNVSARGTSSLFLWFCPIHGHCYGFHLTNAEGRKDPSASLYTHLEYPPQDIFYDFSCNLQEYCLNRESDFYKNVRFFHDIFHGFSHKCSKAYRSSRLQGFECINSEICEQFNSFIQCIKPSARQMNQPHFCFYLQFFLNIWNEDKYDKYQQRLRVAHAGL